MRYDPTTRSWKTSRDYSHAKNSIAWALKKYKNLIFSTRTHKIRGTGESTTVIVSNLAERHTSDEFSETFPKSGMTASGKLFPLETQERLIRETVYGCLPPPRNSKDTYLTPTAFQIEGGDDRVEERTAYRESIGRKYVPGCLAEQVKWSSPIASDAQRGPTSPERNEKKLGGISLVSQAAHYETPRAHGSSTTIHGRPALAEQAKRKDIEKQKYQTPTRQDFKRRGPNSRQQGRPEQIHKMNFPTPNVCGLHNRKGASDKSGDGLSTRVKDIEKRKYHTPRSNSSAITAEPDETFLKRNRGEDSLARQIQSIERKSYSSPKARDWKGKTRNDGDFNSVANEVGDAKGSLSATWTGWLMGIPRDHTSLEPISRETFEGWLYNAPIWWDVDPADVGEMTRIAVGVKDRVNRLKAIGNGIVPATCAIAFLTLLNMLKNIKRG